MVGVVPKWCAPTEIRPRMVKNVVANYVRRQGTIRIVKAQSSYLPPIPVAAQLNAHADIRPRAVRRWDAQMANNV